MRAKNLKQMASRPLFRVLLIVPALVMLAGCEFFVAAVAPTPTLVGSASSSNRPLVTVDRGTIEQAIRATGRVVAREREDLYFVSGGRIKSVSVRQGDIVEAGTLLAELETGNLESQVESALESFETASLRVKAAEQALANEQANSLQQLLAARNDVIRKQEAIDLSRNGGDPDLVTSARAQLAAAQMAYSNAQTKLQVLQASPANIRSAVDLELNARLERLASLQLTLQDLSAAGPPSDGEARAEAVRRLADLRSSVTIAQANVLLAEENLDRVRNGATGEDLEQARLVFRRAEINYENSLERNFSGDQREQFEITYNLALLAYERAVNPGDEADIAKAQVALDQARTQLERARESLENVLSDGNESGALERLMAQVRSEYGVRVANSQLAVVQAQRSVDESRVELSNIDAGLGSNEQRAAQASFSQATNNLARAQSRLAELLDPPPADLDVAQNALDAAVTRLDNLEARYSQFERKESQKDIDLTIATNNFDQARIQLERLQAQTFENQIVAPFGGEITFTRGRAGDQVQAYQEIIGLSNPANLVIESLIPETDFENLSIGQIVDVQLDAFPGRNFVGTVSSLPRNIVSNTGQTIKIPETEIEVDWGNAAVELGMLARLKITVQVKEDVLKVPVASVRRVNAREFVETIVDGQRRSLQVTTGIASDVEIEIESGLEEGMEIYASP